MSFPELFNAKPLLSTLGLFGVAVLPFFYVLITWTPKYPVWLSILLSGICGSLFGLMSGILMPSAIYINVVSDIQMLEANTLLNWTQSTIFFWIPSLLLWLNIFSKTNRQVILGREI